MGENFLDDRNPVLITLILEYINSVEVVFKRGTD